MAHAILGGPVLLKQGYMREKSGFGWQRNYYRLLQDSLFAFRTHESKTPKSELELFCAKTKDCSWELKRANCIEILTENGKRATFECESTEEHRQWFDALYYATNVGKIAEYCSPLSGGWLHHLFKGEWQRLWNLKILTRSAVDKSREDATPVGKSGKALKRLFVIPLIGAVIAYYKSTMAFSFSIQLISAGEVKTEFIFAAASEPIMNVWMEVLYVSTGKMLPGDVVEKETALELDLGLDGLAAEETPAPSVTHRTLATGKGVEVSNVKQEDTNARVAMAPERVDHGVPPIRSRGQDLREEQQQFGGNQPEEHEIPTSTVPLTFPQMPEIPIFNLNQEKRESGSAENKEGQSCFVQ